MTITRQQTEVTGMKLGKIEHVAINTLDFEKSAKFYEEILGLKRLNTVDCGEFAITCFELPGAARLELFDYRGKTGTFRGMRATPASGIWHLPWLTLPA
jgi:catechol 2,3-dioxygenase-like lactoylglutathione lyase family enzyme